MATWDKIVAPSPWSLIPLMLNCFCYFFKILGWGMNIWQKFWDWVVAEIFVAHTPAWICSEVPPPSSSIERWIKCFSRLLLVAHGRKPSNPHFHGPIRWRISEEDRRNVWKFFSTLPTLIKRNQDKKLLEISGIFLKESTR